MDFLCTALHLGQVLHLVFLVPEQDIKNTERMNPMAICINFSFIKTKLRFND